MHLVFPHLQVKRTSSSEYGHMHVLTNVFYNNPLLRDPGVFCGGGGGHGKVKCYCKLQREVGEKVSSPFRWSLIVLIPVQTAL